MATPFIITDAGNQVLRAVDASGIISTPTIISTDTVWLNNGGWATPWGMAQDATGNLYVVDNGGDAVYKIDPSFNLITIAGTGGAGLSGVPGPALSAHVGNSFYCACDAAGNVYISNGRQVVLAVNMQATTQTLLGVSIPAGNIAIVAGMDNNSTYSGDGGAATSAGVPNPFGIALDAAGSLYICSQGNIPVTQPGARIRKVDHATGIITTVAGDGTVAYTGDGSAATSAQLGTSIGVALDTAGNIYITSTGFDAWANVRVVNTQGTTQTLLGVSVGAGNIATVVGGASNGFSGDGGLATSALLGLSPWASRVASNGDLYIVDTNNNRVRKVDHATGIITTVVDLSGAQGYTGDGGPATAATIGGFGLSTFDVIAWPATTPPPPPPPPPPPCAALDTFGAPVNGVFIPDLSLFIIPSTSLYKDPVPNFDIALSETALQGRREIILDFAGSNGLWKRDLGTIFTWATKVRTVLYVWQPSIIPSDNEIIDRLVFHALTASLGTTGWSHAREANLEYISTSDITLTLEFDFWPNIVLTIPNSGGQQIKTKVTLPVAKWKLIQVVLSSPTSWKCYGLEMKIGQWGRTDSYRVVQPVVI